MKVQVYSKDTMQPTTFDDIQVVTTARGEVIAQTVGVARRGLHFNAEHAIAVVVERGADERLASDPSERQPQATTDGALAAAGTVPVATAAPELAATPPGTVA